MVRILILFSIFISSIAAFGQPKFQLVGPERFDIGDVPNYVPHKQTLTIKNTGNDTLILSDVGASCGCTATLLSIDRIPPGDSGILTFTFDAKRFDGKVEKKISMNTNDATHRHVEIFFTANVVKILEIQPEYLFFRTSIDSAATQTLKIQNLSTEPISFTSIIPTGKDISVEFSPKVIKPGESGDLVAKFAPIKAGTTNGNIEIKTTHPGAPSLTVRFFCWAKEKN
ncbi:MAG: DUF1573 domain-containing protein [Ignavibacteriales bacterium]|nr:DUF1573 domain-containing protein [Ignavibacteriales bacterium]